MVENHPTIAIPPVRTFGRLETDDWLAAKQFEESGELRDAAREWLSEPTDETRTAMLDELADLLQTIANMCAAYHIDVRDIADALDRCWYKNMRREQPDEHGLRPNMRVRDKRTGYEYTVMPSDQWLKHRDKGLTGVLYENDTDNPRWIPTDALEPVEGNDGANDD